MNSSSSQAIFDGPCLSRKSQRNMLVGTKQTRQRERSQRAFFAAVASETLKRQSRVLPNGETLSPAYPSVGESCRMMATPQHGGELERSRQTPSDATRYAS